MLKRFPNSLANEICTRLWHEKIFLFGVRPGQAPQVVGGDPSKYRKRMYRETREVSRVLGRLVDLGYAFGGPPSGPLDWRCGEQRRSTVTGRNVY